MIGVLGGLGILAIAALFTTGTVNHITYIDSLLPEPFVQPPPSKIPLNYDSFPIYMIDTLLPPGLAGELSDKKIANDIRKYGGIIIIAPDGSITVVS